MDFRDLLDPAHPITKWWDAALFPMACEHSVFRYAVQQVPLQSPEAQVVLDGMSHRGGGGVGTRPRYLIVRLWRRLLASRHCSF